MDQVTRPPVSRPLNVGLLILASYVAGAAAQTPPGPRIPIGKDTTYVTGPIDKDGYVDFEGR